MRNPSRNTTKVSFTDFSIFPFSLSRMSLKVWLFLAALALTHLFLGYKIAGRPGLWIGFLLASTLILLIFTFSDPPLIEKYQAVRLKGQDAWNLRELAQKYARLAGVPLPDLYLMDRPTAIAFSMGPSWNQARVCVSTALLRKFSSAEIEAVIAHQVCHLRRLETFSFGVGSVLAHSVVGLAVVMDRGWFINWTKHGLRQRPFLTALAPVASMFLRMTLSDQSYFENDDLAASLIPDRKALATALWKMESYCQTEPLAILPCTNHLFMVNPEGLKESNWFFVTHPKIESRIKRLVGTYPL
jgi:heat shock protein HtpX